MEKYPSLEGIETKRMSYFRSLWRFRGVSGVRLLHSGEAHVLKSVQKEVPKKKRDPMLLQLGFWLIVFSSAVSNVIDKKRQHNEMERRKGVKLEILRDIKERLQKGEKVNIENELKIVNNMELQPLTLKPRLEQKQDIPDQSLEDIWKDILSEVDNTNHNTSLQDKSSSSEEDGKILTDMAVLQERAAEEQEYLNYRLPTDSDPVVDKPGWMTEKAKDKELDKFL